MAAPHGAAKLEASSLHTPVNPHIPARGALYERQDPLDDLAAAAAALEEEDEEEEEEEPKAVRRSQALVL